MRNACAVALLLLLAGCNRGSRDREAIRQGVIDHLAGTNVNVAAMDVDVTSVQFKQMSSSRSGPRAQPAHPEWRCGTKCSSRVGVGP
jgi:hypothetical protein